MTNSFWCCNFLMQFIRVFSLTHIPDTPAGIAKTFCQLTNRQLFHITTNMHTTICQKTTYAVINAT